MKSSAIGKALAAFDELERGDQPAAHTSSPGETTGGETRSASNSILAGVRKNAPSVFVSPTKLREENSTPRTDAEWENPHGGRTEMALLARKLERELAAAIARAEKAEGDLDEAVRSRNTQRRSRLVLWSKLHEAWAERDAIKSGVSRESAYAMIEDFIPYHTLAEKKRLADVLMTFAGNPPAKKIF